MMTDRTFNKVFGIGLSRTGTSSLNNALIEIGLNSRHLPRNLDDIDHLDGATDTSITRVYKELDQRYPGSKFVLTTREENEWINSCHHFFSDRSLPGWMEDLQHDIYGTPVFDQFMYRIARRFHHEDVLSYFANRPDDLLVMDVCAGEGYEKLCPFLGLPFPKSPFPKFNSLKD